MWTKCQIRTDLSIQIEPQRLDFEAQNRASEARVASFAFTFKTASTNEIVSFLWVFTHFHLFILGRMGTCPLLSLFFLRRMSGLIGGFMHIPW